MSASFRFENLWDGVVPSRPLPYFVDFSFSENGDMTLHIDAPYFDDPAPACAPGRIEGLYEYELVEIFISGFASDGESDFSNTPYLEIHVGPHGHYCLIFFMGEANWESQDTSLDLVFPPNITIDRKKNRWKATLSIPAYYLPEPVCGADFAVEWRMNAYAMRNLVIDSEELLRECIAYSPVPGDEPNFHQLRYFQPLKLSEAAESQGLIDRTKSIASDKSSHSPLRSQDGNTVFTLTEQLRQAAKLDIIYEEDTHKDSSEDVDVVATSIPRLATVDEVCRTLREELLRSSTISPNITDLEEQYLRHLQREEFVVLHSVVWKRRGISYKKRKLILTSMPRLIYTKLSGEFKGSITWSMTKRLSVNQRDEQKFDITTNDESRVYHFSDSTGIGAETWVHALDTIMRAQKQYLVLSRKT